MMILKFYFLLLGAIPKRFRLDFIVESDDNDFFSDDFTLRLLVDNVLLIGSVITEYSFKLDSRVKSSCLTLNS